MQTWKTILKLFGAIVALAGAVWMALEWGEVLVAQVQELVNGLSASRDFEDFAEE